jgi:hypothetical protein
MIRYMIFMPTWPARLARHTDSGNRSHYLELVTVIIFETHARRQ